MPAPSPIHLARDDAGTWWEAAPENVVVLLQGDPEQVRSVSPTLVAVRPDTGLLILARAIPFEWIDDETLVADDDSDELWPSGDVENDVIEEARATLIAARDLVPSASPALVVFPGLPAHADRLVRPDRCSLILTAIDDDAVSNRG